MNGAIIKWKCITPSCNVMLDDSGRITRPRKYCDDCKHEHRLRKDNRRYEQKVKLLRH